MKQIYAALQIGEDEARLLVGEYFSTRFNIIKLEKLPCTGISHFRLVDKDAIKETIIQLCENTKKSIGASITKVILLLPSVGMKRYSLKIQAKTSKGYLEKSDVARAISEAFRSEVENRYTIINVVPTRYTVNGISLRRLPEKEVCDYFNLDIDLLCIEKEVAFEYVSLVEECSLDILDICLDSYAVAKEAALFEQTMNQNVVLLSVGKRNTVLSLLSKGKLVSCEYLPEGLSIMADSITNRYGVPQNLAYRLLKFNSRFTEETANQVVYASGSGKDEIVVTAKEISELCKPFIDNFIEKICTTCQPVFDSGSTSITLTDEGAEMLSLQEALQQRSQAHIHAYAPETIGVRDASLAAIYGSFFVYRELAEIRNDVVSGIDLQELENVIAHKAVDYDAETLTTKIKNLFATDKNKEDEA